MWLGPTFRGPWFDAVGAFRFANNLARDAIDLSFDQRELRRLVERRERFPTGGKRLHRRGKAKLPRRQLMSFGRL